MSNFVLKRKYMCFKRNKERHTPYKKHHDWYQKWRTAEDFPTCLAPRISSGFLL